MRLCIALDGCHLILSLNLQLTRALNIVYRLVHLFPAYYDQGLLVTDHALLRTRYMTSGQFLVDTVSLLPTDILMGVLGVPTVILRLNRLGRLRRLWEFSERTECRTNYPNTFRIVNLVVCIILIIHWNACFYFVMSSWIGFGSDGWVYYDVNETLYPENASLPRMYVCR